MFSLRRSWRGTVQWRNSDLAESAPFVGVKGLASTRPTTSGHVQSGQANLVAAPPQAQPDPGLYSLVTIAGYYRIAADSFQLAHDLGLGTRPAVGEDIVRAAKRIGLKARLLRGQQAKRLATVPMPAIIRMKDGEYRILTTRMPRGKLRTVNPLARTVHFDAPATVADAWDGEIILVTRRWYGAGIDPATFGFRWFLP